MYLFHNITDNPEANSLLFFCDATAFLFVFFFPLFFFLLRHFLTRCYHVPLEASFLLFIRFIIHNSSLFAALLSAGVSQSPFMSP